MTDLFDPTSIDTENTSFLHLKRPDTEELIYVGPAEAKAAVGITFHAPGSEAYEAATSRRTNRSLTRSKRKIDLTADMLRTDTLDFLTDITVSFDNLVYAPAGDATGPTLFKALYADRKRGWIVEQANAHLADWASFTKGSATS